MRFQLPPLRMWCLNPAPLATRQNCRTVHVFYTHCTSVLFRKIREGCSCQFHKKTCAEGGDKVQSIVNPKSWQVCLSQCAKSLFQNFSGISQNFLKNLRSDPENSYSLNEFSELLPQVEQAGVCDVLRILRWEQPKGLDHLIFLRKAVSNLFITHLPLRSYFHIHMHRKMYLWSGNNCLYLPISLYFNICPRADLWHEPTLFPQ